MVVGPVRSSPIAAVSPDLTARERVALSLDRVVSPVRSSPVAAASPGLSDKTESILTPKEGHVEEQPNHSSEEPKDSLKESTRQLVEQLGQLEARCVVTGDKIAEAMVITIKHLGIDVAAMVASRRPLPTPNASTVAMTENGADETLAKQVVELQQMLATTRSQMEAESRRADFWVQRSEALNQEVARLLQKERESCGSNTAVKLRGLLSGGSAESAEEQALLEWLRATEARTFQAEAERDHATQQLTVVEKELIEKLTRDTSDLRAKLDTALEAVSEKRRQLEEQQRQFEDERATFWEELENARMLKAKSSPAKATEGETVSTSVPSECAKDFSVCNLDMSASATSSTILGQSPTAAQSLAAPMLSQSTPASASTADGLSKTAPVLPSISGAASSLSIEVPVLPAALVPKNLTSFGAAPASSVEVPIHSVRRQPSMDEGQIAVQHSSDRPVPTDAAPPKVATPRISARSSEPWVALQQHQHRALESSVRTPRPDFRSPMQDIRSPRTVDTASQRARSPGGSLVAPVANLDRAPQRARSPGGSLVAPVANQHRSVEVRQVEMPSTTRSVEVQRQVSRGVPAVSSHVVAPLVVSAQSPRGDGRSQPGSLTVPPAVAFAPGSARLVSRPGSMGIPITSSARQSHRPGGMTPLVYSSR